MNRRLCALALSAILLLTLGASGAAARQRAGYCSLRSASYTLSVKRAGTTSLQVRFVVSNAVKGERWQLFGSDNGDRIFSVAKTASKAGAVSVSQKVPDLVGTDVVKASAASVDSGEICQGLVSF